MSRHARHVGFKKLKAKLARKKGIRSPGGLAYKTGAKKYGKARMARKAAAGRRRASRAPRRKK